MPPIEYFRFSKLISDFKCNLGEGLFVNHNCAAWVDINNRLLFLSKKNTVKIFELKCQPSVVYNYTRDSVFIGADIGIVEFDALTNKEKLLVSIKNQHDIKTYRSNDGGYCEELQLLSFMHKKEPSKHKGFLYSILDGKFILIDDTLHIPNTFINIDPFSILISDSLKNQIFLYKFNKNGTLYDKSLWSKLEKDEVPDGGCMINDLIFISLWDNSAIGVFNKKGKLLQKLKLPIMRPTNCKFNKHSSSMIITSASEGLDSKQLKKYPMSGCTLKYNVKI